MSAAAPAMTRILVYFDQPTPTWNYLPWSLHDPLLLVEGLVQPEVRVCDSSADGPSPDLSAAAIGSFDVVIVPFAHRISEENVDDILSYLDSGGALFLVKPASPSAQLPPALAARAGVVTTGWAREEQYHTFSLATDHPATRILGAPDGTSLYPHSGHAAHPRFAVDGGAVLTRMCSGDPDLFVSSSARIAIAATDLFNDLQEHEKEMPGYYEYRRSIVLLVLNALRQILGHGFVVQPVQRPQQRWSDLFSAYGAGREYVASVQRSFPDRLSEEELSSRLREADELVHRSAERFTHGGLDEGGKLYESAVRLLAECMDTMTTIDRYLLRGWQANALFDHDYGGGLLGFAQTQWMDLLLEWMTTQLDWISTSGAVRVHAISSMTWEIMAKYYPDEVRRFARATNEGRLEAVSGLYTQSYLPLLSAESNVRQFSYGHRVLRDLLGTRAEVFLEPRDHFNFHPQLPQILAGFGIEHAVLRCLGHLGEITPVHASTILWRGLDGTELESIPTYEGIPSPHLPQFWLDPQLLAAADRLGYSSLLLGDSFDSTLDFPGEKEHTFLNAVAPVAGTWTTAREYFRHAAAVSQSVYFGVDDLYARLMEVWSSFGCLNEAYGWNRATEACILSAERFSTIAAALTERSDWKASSDQAMLDEAWKQLMATQDRMTLGSANYDDQMPPFPLEPGQARSAKHYWGYHLAPLPEREKFNTMGMENLQEMLTENYPGPMVPVSRYQKVVEAIESSRRAADGVLENALAALAGRVRPAADPTLIPVVVFNQLGSRKRDVVTLEREFAEGCLRDFVVSDGRNLVPHQVLSAQRHADGSLQRVTFLLHVDVPPVGYTSYFLARIEEGE